MKTGRSLEDLAREITRQAATKKDYVAKTDAIMPVVTESNKLALRLGDHGEYPVNEVAHGQIAEHTKIPRQYYNRMRDENPALLATNIDAWFKKYPTPRMVRTLDGGARAVLSPAFRPLDNFDFANAMLPVIADRKLEIMSCEITERRLYVKAVDARLFRDVPVGYRMGDGSHQIFDTCAPAIILSNSEVGYGRLVVETGVYTKACTNLALFADGGMKRTHVGARHNLTQDIENIDEVLTERTKQKTDEALWLQVRDVLAAAFKPELIGKRIERIAAAAGNRIEGKVEKVVELAAERFSLNAGEQESVLKFLIEGGSLTQYGLHAAVTRSAQDAADYDRATELEYLGGRIVELTRNEWNELAMAA